MLFRSIVQMNSSVNDARQSIFQNADTVALGLKEISSARNEAGTLLDLQTASNQKVVEVESNLKVNEGYQNEVSVMAEDMSDVTLQSLNQVNTIQSALEAQAELTSRMQEAFEEVQAISDLLLSISQQNV